MFKNVAFVKYSRVLVERSEVILKGYCGRLADFLMEWPPSWQNKFTCYTNKVWWMLKLSYSSFKVVSMVTFFKDRMWNWAAEAVSCQQREKRWETWHSCHSSAWNNAKKGMCEKVCFALIPFFAWIIILLFDGCYIACGKTYWPGRHVTADKAASIKWGETNDRTMTVSNRLSHHIWCMASNWSQTLQHSNTCT